ncbi:hypothetical protein L596_004993 [Steinernema carpocapsae]|uniref:Uncharacterized protein n=1 Tax=Steinernema carpocapsae TaxID=34508 RepID=A0A4V6I8A8_STECR|nr:hypothetical protein L596_004993 [Steinernema carpocapsae]
MVSTGYRTMRPSRCPPEHILNSPIPTTKLPKAIERLEQTSSICAVPDDDLQDLQDALEKILTNYEADRKKSGLGSRRHNTRNKLKLKPVYFLKTTGPNEQVVKEHDEIRRKQQRDALLGSDDDEQLILATDVPQRFWKFTKKFRGNPTGDVVRQFNDLFVQDFHMDQMQPLFENVPTVKHSHAKEQQLQSHQPKAQHPQDHKRSPEPVKENRYRLRSEGPSRLPDVTERPDKRRRFSDASDAPSTSTRSRVKRMRVDSMEPSSREISVELGISDVEADVPSTSTPRSSNGFSLTSRQAEDMGSFSDEDGDDEQDDEDDGEEEEEEGDDEDDDEDPQTVESVEGKEVSDGSAEPSTSEECGPSNVRKESKAASTSTESKEKDLKFQTLQRRLKEMLKDAQIYTDVTKNISIAPGFNREDMDDLSAQLAKDQERLKRMIPVVRLVCDHAFEHVLAEHAIFKRTEALRQSEEKVFKWYDHLYGNTMKIRELKEAEIQECKKVLQSHNELNKYFFDKRTRSEPPNSRSQNGVSDGAGRHNK